MKYRIDLVHLFTVVNEGWVKTTRGGLVLVVMNNKYPHQHHGVSCASVDDDYMYIRGAVRATLRCDGSPLQVMSSIIEPGNGYDSS